MGKIGSKDTGGMSIYIRELSAELGKQGHQVDIFTRAHNPMDSEIVEIGQGIRLIHLRAGEVKDIDKSMVYSYLDDFASSLEDFRRSCGLRYDLIHSHYWLSGCVGRLMKELWQVPHMMMFHTLGAVKNAASMEGVEPDIRIKRERGMVQACDRIIAATEQERTDLINYYHAPPGRITVVPCGVNLELFRSMDKELARCYLGLDERRTILFVGRIEALKGIDDLLRAMSCLQDYRGIRLVVVGGDEQSQPELEGLRNLALSLGIADSVDFIGMVDQQELPYYYNAADVCVIPSYYESFGLVSLESLACGTPIVATRVGIIESLFEHHNVGYMVDNHEPCHLAEGIISVLSNPGLRSKTAEEYRAIVAGFSWMDVARDINEQYQVMLGCREALPC
jgi:D-inositol-3-phosphate glycosyltransferase